MLRDTLFLTGPTASGKTAVGLELARRLGGEIVSLDSMAVYRGMDLGTAKPTAAERAAVPHHLLDIVEPSEEFSVAEYLAAAERTVADIVARGRRPIFVGGTPLYLKALLRGMVTGPPPDWPLRRALATLARTEGIELLHARLALVDPACAARLHAADTKRVIRAIEVFEKTGRPLSEWQRQRDQSRPAAECPVFVLDWPRDELYRRIDERVERMFGVGLVEEVRSIATGVAFSRTAAQAVGYREVLEHLAGERDLAATIALVQTRTRQFAKRQLTWFRGLAECRWIAVSPPFDSSAIAAGITNAM